MERDFVHWARFYNKHWSCLPWCVYGTWQVSEIYLYLLKTNELVHDNSHNYVALSITFDFERICNR